MSSWTPNQYQGRFNPRSPWEERLWLSNLALMACSFQSTLPVGGATSMGSQMQQTTRCFNPRFPWEERHFVIQRASYGM